MGILSPDRRSYWDGRAWLAPVTPDGKFAWDGSTWIAVVLDPVGPDAGKPPSAGLVTPGAAVVAGGDAVLMPSGGAALLATSLCAVSAIVIGAALGSGTDTWAKLRESASIVPLLLIHNAYSALHHRDIKRFVHRDWLNALVANIRQPGKVPWRSLVGQAQAQPWWMSAIFSAAVMVILLNLVSFMVGFFVGLFNSDLTVSKLLPLLLLIALPIQLVLWFVVGLLVAQRPIAHRVWMIVLTGYLTLLASQLLDLAFFGPHGYEQLHGMPPLPGVPLGLAVGGTFAVLAALLGLAFGRRRQRKSVARGLVPSPDGQHVWNGHAWVPLDRQPQ